MAEIRKTDHTPIPPLSNPPGSSNANQTKPVRRVAFSEIPPKHQDQDQDQTTKERRRGCGSGCCFCCAWTCMVVFALVLFFLLLAAIFIAIIQAEMPEVRLKRVSIPRLDVGTSSQQSLLSADVNITIGVSNKNEKVELSYGPMTVDVSSENIKLGQAKVVGFSQKPKNMTVLTIHTRVRNSEVDKEDGALLKSNLKNEEMVLDVVFTGTIRFDVQWFNKKDFPVTVACEDIQQSAVDFGQEPKCSVKMFAFRTLFN